MRQRSWAKLRAEGSYCWWLPMLRRCQPLAVTPLAAALAGVLLLIAAAAGAQQPVLTYPKPATTAGGNASNTITGTLTFQQVFAAASTAPGDPSRTGCTIVNNGTHLMYVTEGLAGSSTTGSSVQLQPTQAFYCGINGIALQGAIYITGTAGDGFYAAQY